MAETVFDKVLTDQDVVNNLTSTSTNPISSKGVYDAVFGETVLFEGAASSSGTEYNLSESIQNFRQIRIECSTNSEWEYVTIPTSVIAVGSNERTISFSFVNSSTSTNPVTSMNWSSVCSIRFITNTKFVPMIVYMNVNIYLKPRRIIGIGRIAS